MNKKLSTKLIISLFIISFALLLLFDIDTEFSNKNIENGKVIEKVCDIKNSNIDEYITSSTYRNIDNNVISDDKVEQYYLILDINNDTIKSKCDVFIYHSYNLNCKAYVMREFGMVTNINYENKVMEKDIVNNIIDSLKIN